MFAVGSAAAARGVVGELLPWLFLGSLGLLGYAHYLVWIQQHGSRAARWILVINTVVVGYLWCGRVQFWVERLLG